MDNNITIETVEKEIPSSSQEQPQQEQSQQEQSQQEQPQQPQQPQQEQPQQKPDISKIAINNEHTALNVMVSFLHMAQKRGAFNFEESAKLWECIQMFVKRS